MSTQTLNRTDLLQQVETLLNEIPTEQLEIVIDNLAYYAKHSEPEDQLLVKSGILPRLVEAAQQQAPATDWEQDLDAL